MAFEFSDDDDFRKPKKLVGTADLDSRRLEFESAWYLYYADLPSLGVVEARKLHLEPVQIYNLKERDAFKLAGQAVRKRVNKANVPTSV